jgi:apolipoprotein N-acyltransferase
MRRLIETLVPPLADLSMLGEDIIEGEGTAIYEGELCNIGSLICFDSIYENLTLDTVRDGAELLVISTNDSWFLDSAGVRMHNAQAKLRAVESGRFIVRSANTGVSSIITPHGEILDYEDALIEGYVISDVSPINQRTLYSYVGNLIVWLSFLFIVAAVLAQKKI